MKQAVVQGDLSVVIEDGPTPQPQPNEVVIKAVFVGANPIDWKGAKAADAVALHGDLKSAMHRATGKDFAGFVHAVGSKVYQFKVGDRVTALNHSSSFAEYSVAPAYTTALLPEQVSIEEASTIPLAYLAAAMGLFKGTSLPTPWNPASAKTQQPIIIYGASSAVGAFAVKLASLANIHPIIAIAGKGRASFSSILDASRGDICLDYHDSEASLKDQIGRVSKDIHFAVDVISIADTIKLLSQVLAPTKSYLRLITPPNFEMKVQEGIRWSVPSTPSIFDPTDTDGPDGVDSPNIGPKAFAVVAFSYLSFALSEGLISGHPYKVQPNGLQSLSDGLKAMKAGKNSGLKYIYNIAATPGVGLDD